MKPLQIIIHEATSLASVLPRSVVDQLAEAIESKPLASLGTEISQRIPHHQYREKTLSFISFWNSQASEVDSQVVATALLTASAAEQRHRDSQSVELVWTGPESTDMAFRRTEQAILQVLDTAQKRITLVSFAVYKIPNVAKSLINAAKRGVHLTVIVETPDKLGGENEYNTIRALGTDVAARSSVYFWPKEKRKLSESNKPGILHVKCAVADSEWLFLSSANLTQQAFTINMELGTLIRGGSLPSKVETQFDRLIEAGTLVEVSE
jgi:phosphatidylserine/phosphatidylglycerophosphate/cardiolipin synthase-like enzyme